MRTPTRLTALALGLALLAPPAKAGVEDYLGRWKNVDSGTRGMTALTVRKGPGGLTLQAWGSCHPEDCDWGKTPATAFPAERGSTPAALTAEFDQGFATRWLIARLRGERLSVETFVRYRKDDSRSPRRSVESFVREASPSRSVRPVKPRRRLEAARARKPRKALVARTPTLVARTPTLVARTPTLMAGAAEKEDCLSFDAGEVQLKKVKGRWKLVSGRQWLLDFGSDQGEGLRAYRVVRRYGFDQQCFVGRPDPGMSYWLRDGKAPAGEMPGEDCLSFDPGKVEAKEAGGRWKVAEGSHWMFDFGDAEDEARTAARLIRKYGFRHSCFVGRPGPSLSYLRR